MVRAPMCDRAPSCVVETVIEAKIGYRGYCAWAGFSQVTC